MAQLPRRVFLQGTLVSALAGAAGVLGLLAPRAAAAAEWPRDAYAAETVEDALRNLYGTGRTIASPEVHVRAPPQAENGAVVPVSVSTDLPDARAISILVERNRHPLAAHLNLLDGAAAYFSVNIKLASSSEVHFIVSVGGKLYRAARSIKVTVGGYG